MATQRFERTNRRRPQVDAPHVSVELVVTARCGWIVDGFLACVQRRHEVRPIHVEVICLRDYIDGGYEVFHSDLCRLYFEISFDFSAFILLRMS